METNIFNNILNIRFEKRQVTCIKHGVVTADVGIHPSGEEVWSCPLCEKELEKAKAEEELKLAHEKELEKELEKFRESNIESEFWNKTLDDYKPQTESQEKALDSVKTMIKNHSGKVILLGSNGVGKSMLGSCAVKELGGKILSMYEISTMIRQSYTDRAEKTELEIVKELASLPFLVIDELGRTKGSDAELNWLSYVLDKRHVRDLPFMILSNTHLKNKCPDGGCSLCFENYLGTDILSRLRQNSRCVVVDGPDFRAKKK